MLGRKTGDVAEREFPVDPSCEFPCFSCVPKVVINSPSTIGRSEEVVEYRESFTVRDPIGVGVTLRWAKSGAAKFPTHRAENPAL